VGGERLHRWVLVNHVLDPAQHAVCVTVIGQAGAGVGEHFGGRVLNPFQFFRFERARQNEVAVFVVKGGLLVGDIVLCKSSEGSLSFWHERSVP
jgi:hypothetical protein